MTRTLNNVLNNLFSESDRFPGWQMLILKYPSKKCKYSNTATFKLNLQVNEGLIIITSLNITLGYTKAFEYQSILIQPALLFT